jgi:phosphoribosylformimino-5-aminoimidazole carboxamide ribotide isomerase
MDLMGGKVVRAMHGERHAYQPIVSNLCSTSEPIEVTHALLQLYPFKTLYIADLDAIQQRGAHLETVAVIRRMFPDLEIWIDAGLSEYTSCQPWIELGVRCVIGSESQHSDVAAIALLQELGKDRAVLSLDFFNGESKGPSTLFENPSHWPERIIGMTLGRVGSYLGPDLSLLQNMRTKNPNVRIYAAGGVRDAADLKRLADADIRGALVASALHDEKVTAAQLAELERPS